MLRTHHHHQAASASASQPEKRHRYTKNSQNVMEALVAEEVERQCKALPPKVAKTISPSEVTAFALNRLPALYATSSRGWQRQWQRAKGEMQPQIVTAVRQGIMAVQRDPLRSESPLSFPEDDAAANALQDLKQLLKRDDLTWQNLNTIVKETLVDTLRGRITWDAPSVNTFDWEKHPHHQRQ